MYDFNNFYINGVWVDPVTSNDFDVINPATEQAIGQISLGSDSMPGGSGFLTVVTAGAEDANRIVIVQNRFEDSTWRYFPKRRGQTERRS
jgi:acyl-CoA reductase-like NAD-dependent aldehyde dehydrogenase